ncbi:ribosome hibernation-promoting factor, HPF/YfiA family [Geobacter sp. SVR]|uniref:ribosome hibernation-promoting factor, HPF/YfiA family n=1 Tax=Geobacter sp. SVR TaxID=2495594 RepID=UPI00143F04A5|nr:ribosome-associated translation inhibitor RaiA [Geobacter sp. SVR]BCS53468.1 ribosomal subunit interface protein [Geobacter sp. SVR]GCF85405.1 ribosomal subunit interface protein [Geobacter sp. SVR]
MQVTTTFRHMEQSEALKSYAEEKLERVAKYIDEPISAQVFLVVEKKIRHIVEIVINAKGISTKASEATNDMYASVDAVIDKIERQLKRYKEKIKAHKPNGEEHGRQISKKIFSAESIDEASAEPVVIRTKTETAKPMSVEEAVMQMDLLHKDFIVFTDAVSSEINVLYRRKDSNYGLIEPQRS